MYGRESEPMKNSVKNWVVATRPWSFPASAMPVAATAAFLFWQHTEINWLNALWALVNIIVFHAAGNAWSDYFDFKRGVDAQDTFGSKTITGGMLSPAQVLALALGLTAAASVAGIGLLLRTGLPLLWIGLGGLACLLFYPALKYRALGDADILLAYALLPAAGTCYAVSGAIDPRVFFVAIPVGLVTVAILHVNNLRDIRTDSRAGISTLAMILGSRISVGLYMFEVLFPFVWICIMCAAGLFPLTCLAMLAVLPLAVGNSAAVRRFGTEGESAIASLDEKTAMLQLLFGGSLTILFFIAALIG